MCTLVVFRSIFRWYPIVAVANRDERLSRASEAACLREGDPATIMPLDRERGGTWIGVNARGVFAAITNRDSIPSVRGLRSRGELVTEALKHPTAGHALASVVNREPGEHNAFQLVVGDPKEAYVVFGNGIGGTDEGGFDMEPRFSWNPLGAGMHIITNLGCGPGSPRANAIIRAARLRGVTEAPPRPSALDALLTIHDGEIPEAGIHGRRQAGTCIHRPPEADYGTKSSTVVRLNHDPTGRRSAWEYWHRERPDDGHNCMAAWRPMLTLPIDEA